MRKVITLEGNAVSIINKNRKHLIIKFYDNCVGMVACTIPRSCSLYYNVDFKKRYVLKAYLKGMYFPWDEARVENRIMIDKILSSEQIK